MCLHFQRRINPLYPDTGPTTMCSQCLLRLILITTNLNMIQTHSFIGKCHWLIFPVNMLKKWTPLGDFLTFLIPGKPCLGFLLLSWVWTTRKAVRILCLEALLLSSHLALLSKMPLISSSKTFRPLIYLRVNTSNLLPLLQSGISWDSLVMRTNVLNIITNGCVLPFISKPNLVRFALIESEYKTIQKDPALSTCIQSLLSKNTIKRVEM